MRFGKEKDKGGVLQEGKRGKPMGGGLFFGVCQFQKPLIKHFGD